MRYYEFMQYSKVSAGQNFVYLTEKEKSIFEEILKPDSIKEITETEYLSKLQKNRKQVMTNDSQNREVKKREHYKRL